MKVAVTIRALLSKYSHAISGEEGRLEASKMLGVAGLSESCFVCPLHTCHN